ncbi:DUF3108 domain-containing protein [Sphingobacterium rhinopitheci]|uniref:DUF3108 domain-containing protein n=1 Tax=Sphingobacterium rhinopitheci TaxID=2781960 RepID=UPI001F525519|nr:DUF3108 domain-containing protein [Sphingobacterium rhinopitheci]MCI0920839.1 DUF3108 domain-containing protein [Sphingobacterium rhinopitheci]
MTRLYTILFIIILSIGLSHAQSLPYLKEPTFKIGEKLSYKLKYGFITAANGVLSVKKSNLELSNKDIFHLDVFGQTSSGYSIFYSVKNQYDSYIDGKNYLPYLYIEDIKENNYRRKEYATFDHKTRTVKGAKGTFKSSTPQIFDLVSAYYFSRNLDLSTMKIGDYFKLPYFLNDEIADFKVYYAGTEKIKTALGMIDCIKFNPEIKPGRIFKKDSKLYLWVTNDGNRIPVKAKVEILIGSVTMEITAAEGLKYELGKRVSYSK